MTKLWADTWKEANDGEAYRLWSRYKGPRLVGKDRQACELIADVARVHPINGVEQRDRLGRAMSKFLGNCSGRFPPDDRTIGAFSRQAPKFLDKCRAEPVYVDDSDVPF